MERQDHQDYYLRRATNARDLARQAANPRIAAIHVELATRYDQMAGQIEQRQDGPMPGGQAT